MRAISFVLLFSALMLGTAQAQEQKCDLKIISHIQMARVNDRNFIPIKLNGEMHNFMLDTGGFLTQVSRPVAEKLKLPIRQGQGGLIDATGKISRDQALVHELMIGNLRGMDVPLHVATMDQPDGLLALDEMYAMDADMDFGNDTLRFFSPDHCPGQVIYWTNPASVAIVPFTMDGFHVSVPVTLDGRNMHAILDSGAPGTAVDKEVASNFYDLTPGNEDTPEAGVLNGDATLKTYNHRFKSLAFGNISVANPLVRLIPNAIGRNLDRTPIGGGRIKTEKDLISQPEMIVGMNVLRKLHIYFAFKERKMYVSPASVPDAAQQTKMLDAAKLYANQEKSGFKETTLARLKSLESQLSGHPDDAVALNGRCYMRATMKIELDAALADCDHALKLRPNAAEILDSRGFVLYQLGRYQEAVSAFDASLASRNTASTLFMRGVAKGRLGDQAGKDADIAAAKAMDPGVEIAFFPYDVEL